MSEQLERLLWQQVDGELGGAERRHLEALLDSDQDTRRLGASVQRLASDLVALPLVEPPPELRARITTALQAARAPRRSRGRAIVSLVRELFEPPAVRRLAFLGAGMVLGALGYHLLHAEMSRGGPLDLRELYGSMLPSDPPAGAPLPLELADGAGGLEVYRMANAIVLELSVRPGREITLALDSTSRLRLQRFVPGGEWSGQIAAQDSTRVAVTKLGPGHHRLVVQPAQPNEPVELVALAGEAVLLRHRLQIDHLFATESGAATNFPAASGY